MTLRQKQSQFARMLSRLILHAEILGYEVTMGHAMRCKNCPASSKPRLHELKLAQDLNLFKRGRYLSSTKAHEPLGLYWESIGGTWGGRFKDGNHYSLEHNGMK